ncbi:manganese efflux pump MntP family protein [Luteimonas sp. MJ246]|uniref:manganese efflux pump MntP n=1 Tax=Luteimonas sp. MJ174 TaxID=3129237 RepID=UPI0031BB684B
MHPLSILMLGIAMSTDAFAAAVGKGAAMRTPRLRDALRAGLIFGVIEGLTPLAGWALGTAAAPYVTTWDHWIAFTVLTLLGLRMAWVGLRDDGDDAPLGARSRHGFWALAATGFATSIDAMAVGVGLAFLDVNIIAVAATIGLTTLVMVTLGILLGRALGALAGKRAEAGGGVLLMVIGAWILFEHLSGAA